MSSTNKNEDLPDRDPCSASNFGAWRRGMSTVPMYMGGNVHEQGFDLEVNCLAARSRKSSAPFKSLPKPRTQARFTGFTMSYIDLVEFSVKTWSYEDLWRIWRSLNAMRSNFTLKQRWVNSWQHDVCDVCAASYSRVVQGPQGSHRNPWFKDAEVMWVEQCHKPSIWEWFIPTRSN